MSKKEVAYLMVNNASFEAKLQACADGKITADELAKLFSSDFKHFVNILGIESIIPFSTQKIYGYTEDGYDILSTKYGFKCTNSELKAFTIEQLNLLKDRSKGFNNKAVRRLSSYRKRFKEFTNKDCLGLKLIEDGGNKLEVLLADRNKIYALNYGEGSARFGSTFSVKEGNILDVIKYYTSSTEGLVAFKSMQYQFNQGDWD